MRKKECWGSHGGKTYLRSRDNPNQGAGARKFGQDSLEFRQADKNWKTVSALCAQEMADKMIASHGTSLMNEQGRRWYANDANEDCKKVAMNGHHGLVLRVQFGSTLRLAQVWTAPSCSLVPLRQSLRSSKPKKENGK